MIEMTLELAEQASGPRRRGPGTWLTDDRQRRGRRWTAGAVRARRRHRILHARDVEARRWRPRRSSLKYRLAEVAAKGSAFWKTVPVILEGQALPTPGGAPLVRGGRIIGAIGCGGGTGEQDQQCADAAVAALNR
jgi:hypothetical protein